MYKQFLLFPRCFQKVSFPDASKGVIVWEGLKELQESMGRCASSRDITEIISQTPLNTIHVQTIVLMFKVA